MCSQYSKNEHRNFLHPGTMKYEEDIPGNDLDVSGESISLSVSGNQAVMPSTTHQQQRNVAVLGEEDNVVSDFCLTASLRAWGLMWRTKGLWWRTETLSEV